MSLAQVRLFLLSLAVLPSLALARPAVTPADVSPFPAWLAPAIQKDRLHPLELFSTASSEHYLVRTSSNRDYIAKANQSYLGRLLYRGQALKAPLSETQLKELFFRPNRILSSKLIRIKYPHPEDPTFHLVEPWSESSVPGLKASVPNEFAQLVSSVDQLSSTIQLHAAASSISSNGEKADFVSPFISFTEDPSISDRFTRKGRPSIIVTIFHPKAGSIHRDELNYLRIKGLENTGSVLGEREVLVFGVVDPDSIVAIDYRDADGVRTQLQRDLSAPTQIKVLQGH